MHIKCVFVVYLTIYIHILLFTHTGGVAAAVGMLTMSFSMMLGIVLTFSFVLHSLTSDELFSLFIYGGSSDTNFPMNSVLQALSYDYYIILACCILASISAMCLPSNITEILKKKNMSVQQINANNRLIVATTSSDVAGEGATDVALAGNQLGDAAEPGKSFADVAEEDEENRDKGISRHTMSMTNNHKSSNSFALTTSHESKESDDVVYTDAAVESVV